MQDKNNEESVDQRILSIAKKEKPANVKQLVDRIKTELPLSEQEIVKRILHLQANGSLTLVEPSIAVHTTPKSYIFSNKAYWYWIIIALTFAATFSALTIADNAYPAVYIRYTFGTIFIWLLPGYSFVKMLFPTKVPVPTNDRETDFVERVTLSIGMSLVLVILNGFILNYTPFGIRAPAVTAGLFASTIVFASLGAIREFKAQASNNPE